MLEKLALGCVVTAIACGCGKHETSAPHATVTVDVRGENTREIPARVFADGWAVRYERFWLGPTFGIDETVDHRKGDEPIVGAEAYVFGGEQLELTNPGAVPAVFSWTVAGRSTGWGMRLRRVPGPPEEGSPETSLHVSGEATGPAGEIVRFDWRFITEMTFSHCLPAGADALVLPEDGALDVHIVLDGAALFGDALGAEATPRFEALARADADGNGEVTTAELRAASLAELERPGERYRSLGATNLHDFLTARVAYLVAPEYLCQVTVDACQDRPRAVGVCDDSDLADKDYDADGVRNCEDDDIDGDGDSNDEDCDAYHALASLSLCDGSDQHEKDSDADGLRNCEDPDIDDDGIANERDGRPYVSPFTASDDEAKSGKR